MAAHQWISQALGMVDRLIRGRAFGAEHAVVEWEVRARFNPDHFAARNLEIHAALHATVTAVGRNVPINLLV
jgi:hypothetical protein